MDWKNGEFYTSGPIEQQKDADMSALYKNGRSRTGLSAEDLPEWFIPVRISGRMGFVPAAGVVSIYYKPSFDTPLYLFRNDSLHISYHNEISEEHGMIKGADLVIYGAQIIQFVQSVLRYSPSCDAEEALILLRKKAEWLSSQLL